jgi:hypothetical protein
MRTLSLAASLRLLGFYAYEGARDAIKAYPYSIVVLWRSEPILALALKCLVLNGFIFLGSIGLFHFILQPLTQHLLRFESENIAYYVDMALTGFYYVRRSRCDGLRVDCVAVARLHAIVLAK